jgi:hypothetical protein
MVEESNSLDWEAFNDDAHTNLKFGRDISKDPGGRSIGGISVCRGSPILLWYMPDTRQDGRPWTTTLGGSRRVVPHWTWISGPRYNTPGQIFTWSLWTAKHNLDASVVLIAEMGEHLMNMDEGGINGEVVSDFPVVDLPWLDVTL